VALVAAGILASCALVPTSAAAASEPLITRISALEFESGGEVFVDGDINPNELQTTYTIQIECPDHELCQQTEGMLPAVAEPQDVSLKLTSPRPAGTYQLTLTASNADGKTSVSLPFKLPFLTSHKSPPSTCPNGGCPPQKPDTRSEPPDVIRAGEEEAEAKHSACTVPNLKGDTLTAARRALAKAHCRLGAVHRPAHHHGTLYVSAQGAPAGKRLVHNARVALWVGATHGPVRASFSRNP
jgi:hypothetical protein